MQKNVTFYHNKRIVITGAASGIGAEITHLLMQYGANCIAVDIDENGLKALKQTYQEAIETRLLDLSDIQSRNTFMEELVKNSPVDVFFANAGFAGHGPFGEMNPAQFRKMNEVNLMAPVEGFQFLYNSNPGPFHYVITASAMSFVGMPNYAAYSAQKAALHAFSDTFRFEKQDKAKLSMVYPVSTKTAFFTGQRVPWPAQTPTQVAKAVLRAVRKGKREIFPSTIFFSMNGLYFLHRALFYPYRLFYRT